MYDHKESKNRILNILDSNIEIEKKDMIPSDPAFTYGNGIQSWVGALFVDIVGSSEMCKVPNTRTAKVFRAFCSEIIAIMKEDENYREIGIRGDCVYCIYSIPMKKDTTEIFRQAYTINTFMKMFNKLLCNKGFDAIEAGIGIGCGEDLIIKAGHAGSGINDKIWLGKAVVDACNLANIAHRNGISNIAMSDSVYTNIIDILLKENSDYSLWIKSKYYDDMHFYQCNIIKSDFNDWINEGMAG